MPVEVSMVLALYWITLMGLVIWLAWMGSNIDKRIRKWENRG